MKEGPLDLDESEKMVSILISQFEMVGIGFGTRIVSSLLSKFGRPAAVRSSRDKQKESKQEVDIKSEYQNLQEKGLIKMGLREPQPTSRAKLLDTCGGLRRKGTQNPR
jgi:hypothetical protein